MHPVSAMPHGVNFLCGTGSDNSGINTDSVWMKELA